MMSPTRPVNVVASPLTTLNEDVIGAGDWRCGKLTPKPEQTSMSAGDCASAGAAQSKVAMLVEDRTQVSGCHLDFGLEQARVAGDKPDAGSQLRIIRLTTT